MGSQGPVPSVVIVGGGLAGLFCALESSRNGFKTTLLESRASVQTAGDFITIGPSAIRALSARPQIADLLTQVAYNPQIYYHKRDGEQAAGPMPPHSNFGRLISRTALHRILHDAVEDEKIEMRCDAKIVKYTETASYGAVELTSGEVLKADVVVAADGIHSKSWMAVSGEEPATYPSGLAMFRSAFSIEHIKASPSLRHWVPSPQNDNMGFFLANNSFAIMLFGQETANWVWQHKDNGITSTESWAATLSAEDALKQLDEEGEWGPDLRAAIASTPPNHIVDWKLMWRDMRREWVSPHGRVVQIGDAAHPFLPTSVNGGTQALEDAASLATCLRLALDRHGFESIPGGARVHNALRIDRVGAIQLTGMQRTQKHHQIDFEAVKKNPNLVRNEPAQWITDHDPGRYAEENFDQCWDHVVGQGRSDFVNTNCPEGYRFEPWSMRDKMEAEKAEGTNDQVNSKG